MDHHELNDHFHGGDIEHDGGGGGGFYERRDSNASLLSEREGAMREPLLISKSRVNTTSQIAIVGAKVYPIESLDYEFFQGFVAFAGMNVILATCAAALCAFVAPAAAGSGIPEVKAYLNGVDAHSILAPSTLFVKIFGSIFGVSAGFVVGKEGPMVHTGACIANLLGQGGSRKWRSALLWRAFFTTAVVAVVLRTLISFCRSGKCGLFGQGGLIMFDVNSAIPAYNTADLLAVVLIGALGGLFGCLYNYLVDKERPCFQDSACHHYFPFNILLCLWPSLVFTVHSMPVGLEEECPTIGRSGNYKNFQCPPGHYNDLASLFLNTNDDAIRNLFSSRNRNEFHISTLFIFFASIYFLGIITYGIAVPSGLFIPVILAGASYGRLVGRLLGSISNLDVGLFALLGAASFLGGTMRMTVSLCIILLELTNDLLMLPLMMLVLLISKTVADSFNKGVYDQIVKMKGLPYLEAHAEPYMRHLAAGDVCSVLDEPPFADAPELCGLVLRSHLLVLLKGKKFTKNRVLSGSEVLRIFHAFDFAKAGSGKGLKVEDLDLSEEEMEMYVDLHPITNTSPYMVVETMSLAKAAVLFRELGLRHLCVVPKTPGRPPIVGILTRHDFMPEHVLGLGICSPDKRVEADADCLKSDMSCHHFLDNKYYVMGE
ncbi:hypothetical protein DH2020_003055 [Rehmannia glutinosa]|uniref:Chloride channel protein n=1 Tax=Rehmannia glutinosa TaxID=99300 RepID=A0ABR0XKH1_REHGL